MGFIVVAESHVDHGLSASHVAWLEEKFADKEGFHILETEFPQHLSPLECALRGPAMGDKPIPEDAVYYEIRGDRKCASRMTRDPLCKRETRQVTLIIGPDASGKTVLYTAYGGPAAPREPGDPTIATWEELERSRKFWSEHALTWG